MVNTIGISCFGMVKNVMILYLIETSVNIEMWLNTIGISCFGMVKLNVMILYLIETSVNIEMW